MFEWGCMGFLLGALVSTIMIGIGVCYGNHQDVCTRDSDVNIYVPVRYRHRSRTERVYQPTSEEVTDALYVLRLGASDHEKDVIDYLIAKEEANE